MFLPDFERLRRFPFLSGTENRGGVWFHGLHPHPNPRFYKYQWWVFWSESPVDGRGFLVRDYALCTGAAGDLLDDLKKRNERCFLYNRQFPRRDPVATCFDFSAPRWKDSEWALPFDDDPDPVSAAFWQGHR